MLRLKTTALVATALLSLFSSASAVGTCFLPDGTKDTNDLPCFKDNTVSRCCAQDQFCATNKLCVQKTGVRFARGSCLDKAFGSTCPNFCKGIADDSKVDLFQCGAAADGNFCCDEGKGNACCNDSSKILKLGTFTTFNETSIESTILSMSSMTSKSRTSTSTSTSASTSASTSKSTSTSTTQTTTSTSTTSSRSTSSTSSTTSTTSSSTLTSTSTSTQQPSTSVSVQVQTQTSVQTSIIVQTSVIVQNSIQTSVIVQTSVQVSTQVLTSSATIPQVVITPSSQLPIPSPTFSSIIPTIPSTTSTSILSSVFSSSSDISASSIAFPSQPTVPPVPATTSSSRGVPSISSTVPGARLSSDRPSIIQSSIFESTAASPIFSSSTTSAAATIESAVQSATSSSSNKPTKSVISPPAIVGIVVGIAVVIALVAGILCFSARKRKQRFSNRFEKTLYPSDEKKGDSGSSVFSVKSQKSKASSQRSLQISVPIVSRLPTGADNTSIPPPPPANALAPAVSRSPPNPANVPWRPPRPSVADAAGLYRSPSNASQRLHNVYNPDAAKSHLNANAHTSQWPQNNYNSDQDQLGLEPYAAQQPQKNYSFDVNPSGFDENVYQPPQQQNNYGLHQSAQLNRPTSHASDWRQDIYNPEASLPAPNTNPYNPQQAPRPENIQGGPPPSEMRLPSITSDTSRYRSETYGKLLYDVQSQPF